MTVGLVLVAHVAELAVGVRTLAAQMAPEVPIVAAGGTDEGGVGTSFAKVEVAVSDVLADAAGVSGVVVLYDLGSAQMTADMVRDTLDPSQVDLVRVVDAPLVEGALAAATTAAGGGTLDQVVEAATAAGTQARGTQGAGTQAAGIQGPGVEESSRPYEETAQVTATAVLRNPAGLHARPAADLARLASGYTESATVTVGRIGQPGVDARSVLGVVAQGLRTGDEIGLVATGPRAQAAIDAILEMVADGFGELEAAPPPAAQPVEAPPTAQPAEAPPTAQPAEATSAPPAPPGAGRGEHAVRSSDAGVLRGVPASPGTAVGPVRHLHRGAPVLPEPDDTRPPDPRRERARLEAAFDRADAELATRARTVGSGPAADIAAAHRAMLADPTLRATALDQVDAGTPAEHAWWQSVQEAGELLAGGASYVAERAADVDDIGRAVLAALGVDLPHVAPEDVAGAVLVAADLLPSDVTTLADARVAGIALAGGGMTAHVSIIARGLELPLVVGLGPPILELTDGTTLILDAQAGSVHVDPAPAAREAALVQARQRSDARADARAMSVRTSIRYAGRRVRVSANIASAAEARAAVAEGADGVGLLRTELMYVDRPRLPDEDAQVAELTAILRALGDLPVVVRTLDVGGDKLLPALALDPIRHGPLGERGLRHGLRHPEILRTQVRAILRAAYEGTGEVSVMAPMVTVPEEARAFRQLVDDAGDALAAEGRAYSRPARVGVMVEVPAGALAAAEICAEVDFVSVGSNDLAQYLLAADRTNAAVGHLYRQDHPAVWRVIELLVADARQAGCEVAVCGELAGDPAAAGRLVALGVDELSMTPASIPGVKQALHRAYGG
ncbi:phosphoenolpyruvate--protein phosphotransferase [Actinopolymorpha sp. B11F2]|uniref:phosphoenolpyruvate--protein phosphotransferase n=1 Tax=Actinopolymorpha sp. B11F2 TaxID=3160862 RepID=UPI0032E37806